MRKSITALLIILTLILTGCGTENASIGSDFAEAGSNIQNNNNLEFQTEWIDKHVSLELHYEEALVLDEGIYGSYISQDEVQVVVQDKTDGRTTREITLSDISNVKSMQEDILGNVYVTSGKDNNISLVKINSDGMISEYVDVVLEDIENVIQFITPKEIYRDKEGLYYLRVDMCIPTGEIYSAEELEQLAKEDPTIKGAYGYVERVYVKDAEFNTLFYVQIPSLRGSRVIHFYMDAQGIPTFLAGDSEGIYLQQIDVEKQTKREKIYFDSDIKITADAKHFSAIEDGVVYCLNGKLYTFCYSMQEIRELLTLSTYGIEGDNILCLKMSNDKIEIISREEVDGTATYTVLEKGSSEKMVLTLGTLYPTEELSEMISRYNKQQTDVRITIVPYWEEGLDYEEARTKLYMDIITGDAPDLLNVSDLDYSVLAEKDIFVDLYTCMEQDEELQKTDLIASVIQPYERNSKLYALAPAFQIYTMLGRSEVTQGASGVSLKQFYNLLKKADMDLSNVGGFSADEPVLVTLCTFGMDELIDWDKGTCDFEGQYFQDILEFVREYEACKAERVGKSISGGEIAIIGSSIFNVSDYQIACARFGEKLSAIGYPTSSGSGTAVGLRGAKLAINAQEEHIKEAWEFVKYYTLNGYDGNGFPVLNSLFEETLQEAQEPMWVTEGSVTVPVARGSYRQGDDIISVYEADSEDVALIRDLVENATNVFEYDTAILDIIQEEAEYYFSGQKSMKQVTKIIQNRVELYLSE